MKLNFDNKIIKKIGQIADAQGITAFVVGGYVRDKIIGVEDTDIDIMVLGDGINFAKTVAEDFGTELD
ncbi:MAG: tRNA nucleotidyltransferase, partial [Bacteroidota bacterium]|nr:tRNA nucleotidyltransferase [Bacteroidota bacterium]